MTDTPSSQRKRRLRWRPLLSGLILVLILGGVAAVVIARQVIVQPNTSSQVLTSMVVPVERGDLLQAVQVNGALEPRDQARVSFPAGARVREVLISRGASVARGDRLARIETRELELKVESARAGLDQAQQTLDKLNAGPGEVQLAQAAASVARARAALATDSMQVRPIDVEVAQARLASARQLLADLEGGRAPDDLSAAERTLSSAEQRLVEAREQVEQTRDSASRAKTDAGQSVERGLQSHERIQRAYSDAWWDWDFVQRSGRHPTEKVQIPDSALFEHRVLEPHEVEAFRRTLADAEVSLRNSEQELQNLSEAYAQARENELRQIASAERGVSSAERDLAEATRSLELARTRGLPAALLAARQAVAEAERSYQELVDNPERPARRRELEASLLEAVAAEAKLRDGPDPVELARARTALEQARADLAAAEAELDAATLIAPIAGTIVEITLKPDTLTSSSDAVRIADLRSFLIRGQVTEQDVARVRAGQQVEVRVDSVPGEQFRGELLLVSDLPASQDSNEQMGGPFSGAGALGGLYPVEIILQASDERLRVGMATTARIEILAIRDALSIPLQAVEYGEDGPLVRRATGASNADGTPLGELVPVELGATSDDRVQVLSGLSEGDLVIVPIIPPAELGPSFGLRAGGERHEAL